MMGTERHYVPGSFYRIDERTGFAVRAERTKKEWTGRIVRDRSFENRHPQDFVRGRTDNQTVPEARPRQPNTFINSAAALPNLVASFDEQASDWPGTITGAGVSQGVSPNAVLSLTGGSADASVYTSANVADAGSVRNLRVQTNMAYLGWPSNGLNAEPFDLFKIANLAGMADMFATASMGADLGAVSALIPSVWTAYVAARVEIALANTAGAWGAWQKCVNTIYTARFVKFRVVFSTFDQNTACYVYQFNWQVGMV